MHSVWDEFGPRSETYDRESLVVDLASELEVDAAKNCALLAVDLKRAGDLVDNVGEVTGLEGGVSSRRLGVAVLGVSAG